MVKIIVALDEISTREALGITARLKGLVWGFKVNDLLFENAGIIRKLKKYGNVFADAKLYDTPNTVANSVAKLSLAGADMITVHASGGVEMMKNVLRSIRQVRGKSKILAVTVLTSKSGNQNKEVVSLTKDAIKAGVDGIVCSGNELRTVLKLSGVKKLIKVVPGIRPIWYHEKDDQKRTITPREAIQLGADFLVIGRPVLNSRDPVEAVKKILNELK